MMRRRYENSLSLGVEPHVSEPILPIASRDEALMSNGLARDHSMTALTRDDILAALKPAEDTVVAQILGMGATKEEFVEAQAWILNDEALINAGRTLPSGRIGQLIAILQAVDDDA